MEHRWGSRISVDIAVQISTRASTIGVGRILDLSRSGAWISTSLTLQVLSRVIVILDATQARTHEAPSLGAYVTRATLDGFGVEWEELDLTYFIHDAFKRISRNACGAIPAAYATSVDH